MHDGSVRFYVGLHQPADARHFASACISINRIRGRVKPIPCCYVLVDSGAFTELARFGMYRHEVREYAAELRRLHYRGVVQISAAVAQDYMCEPFMLAKTGMTVEDHQRLTIERYDALIAEGLPFHILPVLQGFEPHEYVKHIADYGCRLKAGMWVGVGSVCKRNTSPDSIVEVLSAIRSVRPDLRLHGFGIKTTSLADRRVRELLYSADSMAWSLTAKSRAYEHIKKLELEYGRKMKPMEARAILADKGIDMPNANDWRVARRFVDRIEKSFSFAA